MRRVPHHRRRAAGRRRRPRRPAPRHRRGPGAGHRRRVAAHRRGGATARRDEGVRRLQHPRLEVRRPARLDARSRGSRARPGSSASSARRSARAASSPRPAATSPPRSAPRYVEGSGGSLLLKRGPDRGERPARPARPGARLRGPRARRHVREDVLVEEIGHASTRVLEVSRSRRSRERRRRAVQRLLRDVAEVQRREPLRRRDLDAARGAGEEAARDRRPQRGHRLRPRARLRRDPLDRGLPAAPCR